MSTQDNTTGSNRPSLLGSRLSLAALRPSFVPSDTEHLQKMTSSKHAAIMTGIQKLQADPLWSRIQIELHQEEIDLPRLADELWSTEDASSEYATDALEKLKAISDRYDNTVRDTTHHSTASDATARMHLNCAIEYLTWFQRSLDARRSAGIARPEGGH